MRKEKIDFCFNTPIFFVTRVWGNSCIQIFLHEEVASIIEQNDRARPRSRYGTILEITVCPVPQTSL